MADVRNPAGGVASASTAERITRHPGVTVWLTGLPSSGKTTLALAAAALLKREGRHVEVLDGDEIRKHLSAGLGFSREDRDRNVLRIGYVAQLLASHGVIVFAAVISPYAQARTTVARRHAELGTHFIEVHVSTPVDVCAQRDVKGLYRKQAAGEIAGLTGVDDPYEPPIQPDLHIETTTKSIDQSATDLRLLVLRRLCLAHDTGHVESVHPAPQ